MVVLSGGIVHNSLSSKPKRHGHFMVDLPYHTVNNLLSVELKSCGGFMINLLLLGYTIHYLLSVKPASMSLFMVDLSDQIVHGQVEQSIIHQILGLKSLNTLWLAYLIAKYPSNFFNLNKLLFY